MLKKIMAIACTLFMLFSMSAFALEADTVLAPVVRNGGFESAYSSWDWSGVSADHFVTTEKHSGEKSLRLPSKSSAVAWSKQIHLNFDFISGQSYTLSFWYYNPKEIESTSASGKVLVYKVDTVSNELGSVAIAEAAAATAWKEAKINFTAPDGLTGVDIWLGNYAKNAAGYPIYFDDITLTETPLLTNGDFEGGGWGATGTTVERVSGEAASGDYCTRIAATSGKPSIYKNVTLETNTEYELSFWFKYKGDGRPRWTIDSLHYNVDTNDYQFGVAESYSEPVPFGEDTWAKYTYYFRTGDSIKNNDGNTYLVLYGLTNKQCYYDNVVLVKARNKTMIHDMSAQHGTDVTNIASLSENTTLYAKGRFIPAAASASAVLVAAVFDESTGTKQLKDVNVVPYSTTTGAATTLEAAVTVENPTTSAVEVYMWDSASGLSPIIKKVRTSATK